MAKDYKVTSNVSKENYLKLRGFLMLDGESFSDWLDMSIEEAVKNYGNSPTEELKAVKKIKQNFGRDVTAVIQDKAAEKSIKLCKHGYKVGLCKFGCTK